MKITTTSNECVCRETSSSSGPLSATLTQWAQAWPAVSFTRSPTATFILEVLRGGQKQLWSCQRRAGKKCMLFDRRTRSGGCVVGIYGASQIVYKDCLCTSRNLLPQRNDPGWRNSSYLDDFGGVWVTGDANANQTHLMW